MRREAILGKKIFSTQCQTKDLQSKYKEDSYKSVRNSPFFRKKWLKNLDRHFIKENVQMAKST